MENNIILQQLMIAGTTLLAALPAGCSVGYPAVLLQQLSSNDSSIQLDLETSSWIGSIHGIAGIPSILMPAFMQWRGRKITFILATFVSIIGWILSYTATSSTTILISESVQGFGSQSIMAVGMLSMSEMLSPQIRSVSISLYLVMQTLGMALVEIAGSYLNWRSVSLTVSAPLIVTALVACRWPESPSWLAYKGKFDKCAQAFARLRGTTDVAQTELEELILAQKENQSRDKKINKLPLLTWIWETLTSRDFYLPGLHMFILLLNAYWTGCMVIIIYASEIIQRATHNKDAVFFGGLVLNCTMFVCCVICTVLVRYLKPKKILLLCVSFAVIFLLSASAVNYSQTVGWMTKESHICFYFIIGYMIATPMTLPIIFTIASELMPVKHRGIGGPLYVILTCLFHASALKLAPYLFKYINLWGTFLLYAVNGSLTNLFIWKYIPETKGRTLQQLEDYYAYGNIDKRRRFESKASVHELMVIKVKD